MHDKPILLTGASGALGRMLAKSSRPRASRCA
jgi:hypothetical protein